MLLTVSISCHSSSRSDSLDELKTNLVLSLGMKLEKMTLEILFTAQPRPLYYRIPVPFFPVDPGPPSPGFLHNILLSLANPSSDHFQYCTAGKGTFPCIIFSVSCIEGDVQKLHGQGPGD